MSTSSININPKLGEGIFSVKDVANILNLDLTKVRRWISGYWDSNFIEGVNYTFGEKANRSINFYSLIEFYTFFKLREKKIGIKTIKSLHNKLSKEFNTLYPFALAHDFFTENRREKTLLYFKFKESLIKFDKKNQFSLDLIQPFLSKIDFDENNFAKRFYPIGKNRNVVVDPKNQFGQPIISGTNIKTQTIYYLHLGGETDENICTLYHLSLEKVQDAINFHIQLAA